MRIAAVAVQHGLIGRFIIGCILALALPRLACAATSAEIQKAIDLGKGYLYQTQAKGNWEIVPAPDATQTAGFQVENTQYGGLTAAATFALLACGDDPQDPRIKQAIAFLKKTDSSGTYALGLRCQIWNLIPQDDSVKLAMKRDRDLLIKGISAKQPDTGFYGYDTRKPGENVDHSTSQFGVLGLWAVNQAGSEVPPSVWNALDSGWRAHQLSDGGWAYRFAVPNTDDDDHQTTLSMTLAGVATLFITQDYTHFLPQLTGNIEDKDIDRGVKWVGGHLNDIADDRRFYTLFGVSRVGLACGYKYIGTTDWFKWGADYLVHNQQPNGAWAGPRDDPNSVPDTSFALLFLARGRAPVVINKLNYDVVGQKNKPMPGTWNQRPRDIANLTRMIGKQIESQLNWQVVNLKQTSRDLHDAPILYMSGSTPPKLSPNDQQTLKEFIEDGGLVLGHADGSAIGFSEGFRKLGESMFPGRSFSVLPADHPLYVAQNFPRSNWAMKPVVEGISNGDRALMLLLPSGDPAKIWQTQTFPSIKKDVSGQLMIDIVLYASDQQGLRGRDQTYLLTKNDAIHAEQTMKVARLQHAGNWDPEPGGWRRLTTDMHNERKIDLDVHTVDATAGSLNQSFKAAHLVVNGGITLTDPARKAIHDFVEAGGTLVVDVAGGAGGDRSAAETELAKIFPDAPRPLPTLASDSAVYSAGHKINDVAYRRYARLTLGNFHNPRLCGWVRNGRVAVIYSPDDISAGLVGEQISGILGYAPESATRLMENILTYAGNH